MQEDRYKHSGKGISDNDLQTSLSKISALYSIFFIKTKKIKFPYRFICKCIYRDFNKRIEEKKARVELHEENLVSEQWFPNTIKSEVR